MLLGWRLIWGSKWLLLKANDKESKRKEGREREREENKKKENKIIRKKKRVRKGLKRVKRE